MAQSRYDLAEAGLRKALACDPDDPEAHALLGLTLSERNKPTKAVHSCRRAVELGPARSFAHYALAAVLHDQDRIKEALEAVGEAIRLDPHDADCHVLRGNILLLLRNSREAMAAAEEALKIDPEHVGAANCRARVLTSMGRRREAIEMIQAALERDPENAETHANLGWSRLHEGNAQAAVNHFREALRLDPSSEWARAGVVEALKARNILYRLLLKFALWTSRLSKPAVWAVFIGMFVTYQTIKMLAQQYPQWRPWLLPILIPYGAFLLMTWLAEPIFNYLLLFDPLGRHALPEEHREPFRAIVPIVFLAFVVASVGALLIVIDNVWGWSFLAVAAVLVAMCLPVQVVHRNRASPVWLGPGLMAVMLVLGTAGIVLYSLSIHGMAPWWGQGVGATMLFAFVLLIAATAWSTRSAT